MKNDFDNKNYDATLFPCQETMSLVNIKDRLYREEEINIVKNE